MLNHTEIIARDAEIIALKNRIKELELLLKHYEERFRLSQKRRFVPSSEKSMYDQLCMDIEALKATVLKSEESAEIDAGEEEAASPQVLSRKKRTRKEMLPAHLPVEEILHELPAAERVCPDCNSDMQEIGTTYREELVVIPAKVIIRRHKATTYACPQCKEKSERVPILKAQMPAPVVKGSFASPEFVAYAAYQKFALGIPLYRQEQEWNRQGVELSRQTMTNWLIYSAEKWLHPVARELKQRLLRQKVLHADETTFQVLREPGKAPSTQSYLWCYRTGGDAEEPIVAAEYKPNRKKENPKDFLKEFTGYLHTDGYDAYHKLPSGIVVVGCWAHVRRKWDEALKIIPVLAREGTKELRGKQYCDWLFSIEKELAPMDADKRHAARTKRLKPVMDEFFAWAEGILTRPKSALGSAISYMLSQRPYLQNVLLDGRLELSNNRAERTIKPFVIGRKNFLFANTPRGADAVANFFSLIETAKETGINPFSYLAYVFATAPNIDIRDVNALEALLPSGYKRIHCP